MSTLTAPFPTRAAVRSDPAVQAFLLVEILAGLPLRDFVGALTLFRLATMRR